MVEYGTNCAACPYIKEGRNVKINKNLNWKVYQVQKSPPYPRRTWVTFGLLFLPSALPLTQPAIYLADFS